MQRLKYSIPIHLRILSIIFICQIVTFSLLRLVLLFTHTKELISIPLPVILEALWMGIRFDATICGYIFLLPLLVLTIWSFLPWKTIWLLPTCIAYTAILSGIALLITIAGIPFFNHYHSPITISVLDWADQSFFVFRMIFSTWTYYPFIFLFIILSIGFIYLIIRLFKNANKYFIEEKQNFNLRRLFRSAVFSLLALALLFLFIRGRIAEKSPIRWGTAYFSPYPFPNQLALNPVFTFMQSWIERRETANQELHLISDDEAIENVRRHFKLSMKPLFDSPIAREVKSSGKPTRQNVVLVIMENMAAWKMHRYGNQDFLTPFLDSLAQRSVVCDRFYSCGIHTYNGIYSSLFGMPALLSRHPMKPTESIQPYTGIARTLSQNDYQTIYFCTHDAEFDNMAGFLSNNGFQSIISEKDYPQSEVQSTLGVPDHILFDQAIPRLRQLSSSSKPFFAAFLTSSDHVPYVIPDGIDFYPHSEGSEKRIIEYADWAVGHFLTQAEKENWYSNTIFIFIADHGHAKDSQFGLPLSAHHSPLIIFSPSSSIKIQTLQNFGTQLDLYPTIMGLLNISYINNTLGIDIIRDKQPYVIFNSDDVAGCLNDEFFLVRQSDGREFLYNYTRSLNNNSGNGTDIIDYRSTHTSIADSMSKHIRSMYQTAQYMIKHRKVGQASLLQNE